MDSMNLFPNSKPLPRYTLAAVLTLSITAILWLLRDILTLANFSLFYLLIILIIAATQGTGPALFASFISFLCFNYFLVKPLYTFLVSDPRDLLDLVIFWIAAALTGQIASWARQQAEQARRQAREQNILYELTSSFNRLTDSDSVYRALNEVLSKDLWIRDCQVLQNTSHMPQSDQSQLYLLLQANSAIYGVLYVTFDKVPDPSMLRLVKACAEQASMALQRIDLASRANQSKTFEEADRLKTAILHAVSHDLRTPITIIKTSASHLLSLHWKLPEAEQIELARTIENEADQLNKMVGNLLDISRLQAGALQINRTLNVLEEVAGDVAARVWQLTQQERIKLDFPDDLPMVPFDYGLILQALSNLVDNSLRYEPPESKIVIRGRVLENEARLLVINHGPSISPVERDMIMEPFYHGRGGNIGLGLAIAKGIIEAHHGRISLEDTPERGVTFVISLPLENVLDLPAI
jgi:two-component system sensor histidine kinase KdpD